MEFTAVQLGKSLMIIGAILLLVTLLLWWEHPELRAGVNASTLTTPGTIIDNYTGINTFQERNEYNLSLPWRNE
jgi:hypothetical protein